MDGFRFRSLMLISLGLGLGLAQLGWSQTAPAVAKPSSKPVSPSDSICKIYSLAEFAENEKLCRWIVDTIPVVVKPRSWRDNANTIRYNADVGVMVVNQSPEVHAEVGTFLQNLRKTVLAKETAGQGGAPKVEACWPERVVESGDKAKAKTVAQAGFSTAKPGDAGEASSGYLIPAPAKQPKHLFHMIMRFEGNLDTATNELVKKLTQDASTAPETTSSPLAKGLFHFIVRYEGEGLIDASVVEFMKYLPKVNEGNSDTPPAKKDPPKDPLVGPAGYYPTTPPPPSGGLPVPMLPAPPTGNGPPSFTVPPSVAPAAAPAPSTSSVIPYILEILERIRVQSEQEKDDER